MHRAKGLEFDQVLVLAQKASLEGDDADHNRKLAYVALDASQKGRGAPPILAMKIIKNVHLRPESWMAYGVHGVNGRRSFGPSSFGPHRSGLRACICREPS